MTVPVHFENIDVGVKSLELGSGERIQYIQHGRTVDAVIPVAEYHHLAGGFRVNDERAAERKSQVIVI